MQHSPGPRAQNDTVAPAVPVPSPQRQAAAGRQWRGTMADRRGRVQGAPTAWSRLPPFVPSGPPPVLVLRNSPAVVGATLGSAALFLSLIPIVGLVSVLLAPIGLLSSATGLLLGLSRRAGRVGALWGVVTSGLALLVCLAWTSLLLAL